MSEPVKGSISARLHEHGRTIWEAAVKHPMVLEIAAGSLAREKFRHYFDQNLAYLEEYARAVGYLAAKAPDPAALEVVTRIADQIVWTELPANRRFLERLGGDPSAPRGPGMMEPTTYRYTRHLLAAAGLGSFAAGLTALLPCQWSYGEIGEQIAGSTPGDPLYAEWVAVFSNPDYDELIAATTGLLDRVCIDDKDGALAELRPVFEASTRFEIDFWDMAYAEVVAP